MTVKQRQVFYIHGFDPRGAAHYHRLYRDQAAKQSKLNGLNIKVSRRQRQSSHSHQWQLDTEYTHTDYCYLSWDDIIRAHWSKNWWQILGDFFHCLFAYVLTGRIFTFARHSYKQLIAGLFPVIYICSSVIVSGWLAVYLSKLVPWQSLPTAIQAAQLPLHWLFGILLFALFMHGCKRVGDKLAVFWLLRIYAFALNWASGKITPLESKIEHFAGDISRAIQNLDNDEIVIVAHSVGTMVVIPSLAKALASLPNDPVLWANKRVVLMTLGQCIPLLSFQPKAHDFKTHLQLLGQDSRLLWLDYTAPTDGACFPLLDPITSCGLARTPNAGPYLLSPRFFALYHAPHYKKLRRAWYTMHFLYLMANDKLGVYDYFAFTAGPKRIASQIKATI